MKKIAVYFPLLLLICAAPGRAQGKEAYRIGPRDLIQVKVDEDTRFNSSNRVAEDGTINFTLLGDVQVGGKTTAEVSAVLKRLLEEKYMQRATVDVAVLEFRSRPIAVIGAVKSPGNLGFSGRWTLLEALTAAGGLGENHGNVAYILRRADNGLSDQVTIDLDDLLLHGDPKLNIPIYANDLINVPATIEVTVYCLGQVSRPGALLFKSSERISLLSAIAHAGGLTDRASKKILVKRSPGTSGPRELNVDFNKILAGKEPDVELRQGDVIVVKESFF
ncbi:MAG TPA: polysaccharide biosynthesis/export family protein [Thermoanaerobaculia bacterium]|jgi:polysaccharide export outer membrane protein|nr:polysaccharide biosynthesis/export family protein [Thermoanaerobaculia bacterium]